MVATHAKGTEFYWGGNLVAGLNNIGGVEVTADELDVTTHDSEGAYRVKIPGFLDTAQVALEGYFEPTNATGQAQMKLDCESRTVKEAKIVFPGDTGAQWVFQASVMSVKIGDSPVDGAIPFAASVQPIGKPTFTTSAAAGLTTPFLSSSVGDLVPAPAGNVYSYILPVITETTVVKITPTADAGTIKVNGTTVISGAASGDITLGAAGTITEITVVVSEAGKAPKTYIINVARAAE